MIKKLIKRYSFFLVMLLVLLIVFIWNKNLGLKSLNSIFSSIKQMISVVPPIMLLLGLMDAWIPRETMMKYMGYGSGIKGIFLSILMGTIAAGPMYAAFPFTRLLIKKGVRFRNIIIFMNSWCVIKISTLMFEVGALGYKFTLARFLIDLPGVIIMAFLVEVLMPKEELEKLYSVRN